jgi:hypothetical protein
MFRVVLIAFLVAAHTAAAQEFPQPDPPLPQQPMDRATIARRYEQLENDFLAAMESLAGKCDELGMTAQAEQTRSWIAPRSSGRIVFYLTERSGSDAVPASSPERVKQWHARYLELRRKFAEGLFVLASDASAAPEGAEAFRLIHEVLHEDPEHEEARRILGLARGVTRKVAPRAAASEHRQFAWRRGQHWTLESRHFTIESNHSAKACLDLATELEQLHDVWRQLFFPAWGKDELVAGRFAGQNIELVKPRRFRVVLFKDREEYLRQLAADGSNVGLSTGIYLDEQRASVFFAGDEAKRSTWHHEVTHQLFQEYLDAPAGIAGEHSVWMIEAAALFMESLVLGDGFAQLGGYDAGNLQFARFRIRGGDFHLPFEDLARLGREELQSHADIRKIYSQTAGLGHFFLEGEHREAFVRTLIGLYQGRARADSLSEACEVPYSELDRQFVQSLDVTDEQVRRTPPYATIRDLSLRRTSVTDAGLQAFQRCDRLEWLDLSLTAAGDEGLAAFSQARGLRLLFAERTRITDEALAQIGKYSQLEELYLSSTPITDDGLPHLEGLRKLRHLDLAGCPLTDAALPSIAQLRQLEVLDVSGTRITAEGLARLKGSLPRLEIEK